VHPALIDLGTWRLPLLGETHLFLPTYGFLFALGVAAAWIWLAARAREMRLDRDRVFNLVFYTVLAGILGAKLTLIAVDWRFYLENPAALLGSLRSAGVLLGGVLAGLVCFIAYASRAGLPAWALADAAAAPLALAQSVGRLGCFSAGCCFGRPARGAFAVTFTDPLAAEHTGVPLHVPLVPVQLVQMASDLALAGVLTWLWRRRMRPEGTVFWIYVLLYGVTRGVIEVWRGDAQRGLYFGGRLSTSQIIGAAGVVLAAAMLLRGRLRARESRA
jgi:phosphatidylglycerol:prolipoprotein diacylglycerol transferase